MATSLARLPEDAPEAISHARSLGHRFTEAPRVSQMDRDRRLSWRCLDCGAHVIAYYWATPSSGYVSKGADGVALVAACEEVRASR